MLCTYNLPVGLASSTIRPGAPWRGPPVAESSAGVRPLAPPRRQLGARHRVYADIQPEDRPWAAPGYKGAAVSSLSEPMQVASVASIFVALAAATVFASGIIAPSLSAVVPTPTWWATVAVGTPFCLAGAAHFAQHQGFLDMFPHQGAWGVWRLPGSASFHVNWTGVAELLGGAGLLVSSLPVDGVPEWVRPASAWGLFLLTIAVTPANIYMYSHNAPGPLPEEALEKLEGGKLSLDAHIIRFFLQVFLLSTLAGIARS